MNCKYCNSEIKEGEKFCLNCGSEVEHTNESSQDDKIFEQLNEIPLAKHVVNRINNNKNYLLLALIVVSLYIIISGVFEGEKGPFAKVRNATINAHSSIDEENMVVYQGYRFPIPYNLILEPRKDKFIIRGKNDDWEVELIIKDVKYEVLCNSREDLIASFEDPTTKLLSNPRARYLQECSCHTYETKVGNVKMMNILNKAHKNESFVVTGVSNKYITDVDEIVKIARLLAAAEKFDEY